MDKLAILKRFAEYANYDPDQKSFTLLSTNYVLHKCIKQIEIISNYDPSGTLAVVFAKSCFKKLLQEARISAYDAICNREELREDIEMWQLFSSPEIIAAENELLNVVNALVEQVIGSKLLGERDREKERETLFSSVTTVGEQLDKCNEDLFVRGGEILPVTRFSSHIHLFESLADCLLAIEGTADGMYLCYINNNCSSDGYFGFFIKSNGNILSINERVNEAYPGQHFRSRNGRWSEEKKYDLFPYKQIFSFSDYDYKGYASKHMIDKENLGFFNLGPDAYMPLILAMVMLNNKYSHVGTSDMKIKYVDSLLPINIERPVIGSQALIIAENSAIATVNKSLQIDMNTEGVKKAEYAYKFSSKTAGEPIHYSEAGAFSSEENVFVSLYGDGFELDHSSLLEANKHLKLLPDPSAWGDALPNAEFVGTQRRMEMIAYRNARAQLAEHLRNKIFDEYTAFGGIKAVLAWWKDVLQKNKEKIFDLCAEKFVGVQEGRYHNVQNMLTRSVANEPLRYLDFQENCKGSIYDACLIDVSYPFNKSQLDKYGRPNFKYLCPLTGSLSSIFFIFRFNNWLEMAEVVGEENIPKIVQGWVRDRSDIGNPLLNATDAVCSVGTPFEKGEQRRNRRYWTKGDWRDYYFHNHTNIPDWNTKEPEMDALPVSPVRDFVIAVGFSKRGWSQVLKERSNNTK